MKTVIEMAREAGLRSAVLLHMYGKESALCDSEIEELRQLERFAELVRADEREAIEDAWSMCVQSDLEHGVKSLNEQAAKDWFKNYPEIAKFGAWLASRSNT